MTTLNELKTCAGNWQGNSRLHLPEKGQPDDSASTLSLTVTEKAVQFAYTWAFDGKPHHGTLLLHEETPEQAVAQWTDTFHTGGEPMQFHATPPNTAFSLLGSYPAPPGPDWGWRIVLNPVPSFELRMFNITPDGTESIAVEADYHRTA